MSESNIPSVVIKKTLFTHKVLHALVCALESAHDGGLPDVCFFSVTLNVTFFSWLAFFESVFTVSIGLGKFSGTGPCSPQCWPYMCGYLLICVRAK